MVCGEFRVACKSNVAAGAYESERGVVRVEGCAREHTTG